MSANDEVPKKKRRQNVACDSCRLRRIKCDLLTLLADPSSSNPSPLHELVAANPDIICTNCRSKGIKCTADQILAPGKINKVGRRIEEAKRRFGSEGNQLPGSRDERSGSSAGPGSVLGGGDGITDFDQLFEGFDFSFVNPSSAPAPDYYPQNNADVSLASLLSEPTDRMADPLWNNTQCNFDQANLETFAPHEVFPSESSSTLSWGGNPKQSQSGSSSHLTPPSSISTLAVLSTEESIPIWQQIVDVPPSQLTRSARTSEVPVTPNPNSLDGHIGTESDATLKLPGMVFDHLRDKFVSRTQSPPPPFTDSHYAQKRKRPSSPGPLWNHRARLNDIGERVDVSNQGRIQWGRAEIHGQEMANIEVGVQLSRHLIKVFFEAVHYSLPALSPESFYMEWQRAGERSQGMMPDQEVLCAVMEAWAARYSDSPAILGLSERDSHLAPKVITKTGQFTPGTQARAHWGRARLPICIAMRDRARNLIDKHALFRKPSIAGIQALMLYSQLGHMSDHASLSDHMEATMVHTAVVQQMDLLGMLWTTDGDIVVNPDETSLSVGQLRMTQRQGTEFSRNVHVVDVSSRRLFWTMIVSDAMWAAGSGSLPKIPERELEEAGKWLRIVENKLPMSGFKTLFFMTEGSYIGSIKKRPIYLASAIKEFWVSLQYIDQLQARKAMRAAYIVKISPDTSPRSADERIAMLDQLSTQGVDILLENCRTHTAMFDDLVPTGIIQSAAAFHRTLIASTQFLAEIPCNEQGYPSDTLGGCGWTWATKQKEVNICINALYQIGWGMSDLAGTSLSITDELSAWGDISSVLESIHLSMERLQPTDVEMMRYHANPPAVNAETLSKKANDLAEQDSALKAALQFYPIRSIPNAIGQAINPGGLAVPDRSAVKDQLAQAMGEGVVTTRYGKTEDWFQVSGQLPPDEKLHEWRQLFVGNPSDIEARELDDMLEGLQE
ncbi:hypothetical protein P7C73_g4351, partial [Tremellales sp. Uapishka_1]